MRENRMITRGSSLARFPVALAAGPFTTARKQGHIAAIGASRMVRTDEVIE